MKVRDCLNTLENYKTNILFNRNAISRRYEKINYLKNDEVNNIQRHKKTNSNIIQSILETIFEYQSEILISTYSAGLSIKEVIKEYNETINVMNMVWEQEGGYLSMLNMLSMAIILDLNETQKILFELFKKHYETSSFKINDFLLDFLFKQHNPSISIYPDFMIAKPYALLREIIELSQIDKTKAIQKLKIYLQKHWFSALKRQNLIQETHKSPYGTHCGYWSFESGALVKILVLDDSTLKEQQYYPYDLVHYKKS